MGVKFTKEQLEEAIQDSQEVYDNGALTTTSVSQGPVTIKNGTGSDTDNLLEGQNGAGDITFSITGEGIVTLDTVAATNTNNTDSQVIATFDAVTYDTNDVGYKRAFAGDNFLGVHIGPPASFNDPVSLVTDGKVKVDINGTVSVGDQLRVGSSVGHLQRRDVGQAGSVVAIAIEAGTNAILEVILLRAPIRPLRSTLIFKFPQAITGLIADLRLDTDGTTFIYHGDTKRIIGVQAKMGTPDTGASQPVYDLEIGAVDVFTNTYTNSSTADTFGTRESTVAAVDTDLLQDGDKLVLSIGTAGTNGDGFNLEIHVEVEEEIKI